MNFDAEGHLVCTPKEVYELAVANPDRLLTDYLMVGTPRAFERYKQYCDFLEAVSDRTQVHTKNLYVRGSCHIGFSIAPDVEKVWVEMGTKSDLDLVIVDRDYFYRIEEKLREWELRNPVLDPKRGAQAVARRARDRQFNCCRDKNLPGPVGAAHKKAMTKVAALALCGHKREVTAFLYPDWHSAQQRYEYDLRLLCEGVAKGDFPSAPGQPVQRAKVAAKPAVVAPPEPAPAAAPAPAGQEEGKPTKG